jgi:RHS repeat-associated protein
MTDDGRNAFVYDAFNRLRKVNLTGTSTLLTEYRYNGLNFKISFKYDNDRSGNTGVPDGTTDGNDHTYYLGYNERWQDLGTRRDSDTYVNERRVYQAAGAAGSGGSSYINAVVCTDYQARSGWTASAGSALTKRMYPNANWRGDVSAVTTDTGSILETVKTSANGVVFAMPAGDTKSRGIYDATDTFSGGYLVLSDTNQDGTVDSADATYATAITGSYQTLGRQVASSTAVMNRKAYAGYEFDWAFAGTRSLYDVRNRWLSAEDARWASRDKLYHFDGVSAYEYCTDNPTTHLDAQGLVSRAIGATSICVGSCTHSFMTGVVWPTIPKVSCDCTDNFSGCLAATLGFSRQCDPMVNAPSSGCAISSCGCSHLTYMGSQSIRAVCPLPLPYTDPISLCTVSPTTTDPIIADVNVDIYHGDCTPPQQ